MKKILTVLLIIALCLSMTACGSKEYKLSCIDMTPDEFLSEINSRLSKAGSSAKMPAYETETEEGNDKKIVKYTSVIESPVYLNLGIDAETGSISIALIMMGYDEKEFSDALDVFNTIAYAMVELAEPDAKPYDILLQTNYLSTENDSTIYEYNGKTFYYAYESTDVNAVLYFAVNAK